MKKIISFLVLTLLVVSVFIIVKKDLNLKESSDRKAFLGSLTGWAVKSTKNVADTATYAVKKDWKPENATRGA
ncbi:hypothetical protein J4403_02250 [Candidatus Woesearchaeota archaeon]|nr:hypothetical protein [Candidatus Woesearchaeota archaeon]